MKDLDLSDFPLVSKVQWKNLAQKQLKDKDPNSTLNWMSEANIEVEPYYDKTDIEQLNHLTEFFKSLHSVSWKLFEKVEVSEEKLANRQALAALEGGCNGIVFYINQPVDFDSLLKDINLDICDISFVSSAEDPPIKNKTGFTISPQLTDAVDCFTSGTAQVDGIVQTLRALSENGHILRLASSDFFLEVASIRALRYLLSDFLQKDPTSVQIHTAVPLHQEKEQQWFFNATSGLASILGGTSSIQFETAIGKTRISRNVGNLIREECGITAYTDQCGGSYYVEVLTHKIIEACNAHLKS